MRKILDLKEKLDFLTEYDNWSAGGLPHEGDLEEYLEVINDEYHVAYEKFEEELRKDELKALLPIYEAHTDEFESSLGYMDVTKKLRKLSSKVELGIADIQVQIENVKTDGFHSVEEAKNILCQILGNTQSKWNISYKNNGSHEHYKLVPQGIVYDSFWFHLKGPLDSINELNDLLNGKKEIFKCLIRN